MGDSEVDELRQEVVRLTVELDRTSAEKEQAAQYGLVLLEEKDSLDLRCQVKIITSDADPYHVEKYPDPETEKIRYGSLSITFFRMDPDLGKLYGSDPQHMPVQESCVPAPFKVNPDPDASFSSERNPI